MTEPEARPPCINGCVRTIDGEAEQPRLAMVGRYCSKCLRDTDDALLTAGALVGHIISEMSGIGSRESDGSKRTKKSPPLPFNATAFDDANEVYSLLVYWASVWATRLNRQMPGPARHAWRNDRNTIIGLPADISRDQAQYAVGTIAKWLSINLKDIFRHPFTIDIDEFRVAINAIYTLRAKWPTEDRARYVPAIWCWIPVGGEECHARIGMFPPKFAGAERFIRCDHGHVFQEDEYDRMTKLFRDIRKEQAKESSKEQKAAQRVAERLARKYVAGA